MVKSAALLALLPVASAFVAPVPKMAVRGRALQMSTPFDEEPGRVQWFPSSAPYWDPANLAADGDVAKFNKYKANEIKHGRVAMLAMLDYFVRGFGWHFPGELGGVDLSTVPVGIAAIPKINPLGWAQILAFASALDVLAPQKEDRTIGHVQPDSPVFPVPGTPRDQQAEINNGRLAMIAILGTWVGEALTGFEAPLQTLNRLEDGKGFISFFGL